jgi:hypothetical protein
MLHILRNAGAGEPFRRALIIMSCFRVEYSMLGSFDYFYFFIGDCLLRSRPSDFFRRSPEDDLGREFLQTRMLGWLVFAFLTMCHWKGISFLWDGIAFLCDMNKGYDL